MWNKIKYRIVLLFLILSISQGFSQCWLSDLRATFKNTNDIDFQNQITRDNGFANFRDFHAAVSTQEALNRSEFLEFLEFIARTDNPSAFISKFTEVPELVKSWKLLGGSWHSHTIEELVLVNRHYDEILNYPGGYNAWKIANTNSDLNILLQNSGFKHFYDELLRNPLIGSRLSTEEAAVLQFYTTPSGYENFNKALRGGEGVAMTDAFRAQERLMNQALAKLPNSSFNNNELLRIEDITAAQLNRTYQVGNPVNLNFFRSASYSSSATAKALGARNFSTPVLLRIQGRSGKDIESISTLPGEKEILFSSNTRFRVTRIDESLDPRDGMGTIKTVWLEEL